MITNNVNSDYLDLKFKNELKELIHFIRTPLASIKISGEILKEVLPLLLNVYINSSQQTSNNDVVISGDKLNKLYSVIEVILTEANRISEYTRTIENNGLINKKIEEV